LFEDKRDDLLSRLFRKAYPDSISEKFEYANGNGNFVVLARKILETSQENVYVLLDSPPCNPSVNEVYMNLAKLSGEFDKRLIVFNIVCSEYYFIKAFEGANIYRPIYDDLPIDVNNIYFKSKLYNACDKNRKFARNYEKYCKLVLMNEFIDCAKHTRGSSDNVNYEYGYFYDKDCLCGTSKTDCADMTLTEKALNLIDRYPYVPDGYYRNNKPLSSDKIIETHRELVDEFNRVAELYNDFYKQTNIGRATKRLRYTV
jgi:hypothetical protein